MRIISICLAVIIAGCSSKGSDKNNQTDHSSNDFTLLADVVYGHDYGMAMTYDVYVPTHPNGAGIILINSGGWKSPYDTYKVMDNGKYRYTTDEEMLASDSWPILSPKKLVLSGYTVFEVRHGSEPKFVMPEIASHVRRAVRYIVHHAMDYGVDSSRIGLWGGSASGHLALLIGLTSEIALQNAKEDWERNTISLSAIVVFAAPTDLQRFVTDNPREIENRPVLRLNEEQLKEYSPVHYATNDDPPTLIMHGSADETVPIVQGKSMHTALQGAGVTSEFVEFEKTTHSPTIEQSSKGIEKTLIWFHKYLMN
jgi:pimeloyl-ACP methyl ester carboxylesterase